MTSLSSAPSKATAAFFFDLQGISTASKDDLGKFSFNASSPILAKRDVVYVMYDPATLMTYVGKTNQIAVRRLRQHQYLLNNPKSLGANSPSYTYFREHAHQIHFGIVAGDENEELSLEDQETLAIKSIPQEYRLNANSGGGGGASLRSARRAYKQVFGSPNKEDVRPILKDTPEKRYPFDGKKFLVSPATSKAEAVVYSVLNQDTGEIYVGQTGREFGQRSSEHSYRARTVSEESDSKTLHVEMAKSPTSFAIGVHATEVYQPELRLNLEKKLIESRCATRKGYNTNRGGGGSLCARFLKEIADPTNHAKV